MIATDKGVLPVVNSASAVNPRFDAPRNLLAAPKIRFLCFAGNVSITCLIVSGSTPPPNEDSLVPKLEKAFFSSELNLFNRSCN